MFLWGNCPEDQFQLSLAFVEESCPLQVLQYPPTVVVPAPELVPGVSLLQTLLEVQQAHEDGDHREHQGERAGPDDPRDVGPRGGVVGGIGRNVDWCLGRFLWVVGGRCLSVRLVGDVD